MIFSIIFIVAIVCIWIGFKLIRKQKSNPYIELHKLKFENDKNYNEYLKWLHKKKGDIPFNKIERIEDVKYKKAIDDIL
jgi:amino acid permease